MFPRQGVTISTIWIFSRGFRRKDPRLGIGTHRLPLSVRNANTMWMLLFLYHLNDTGMAGFVMATGELSNSEIARLEVRKTLAEMDLVDANDLERKKSRMGWWWITSALPTVCAKRPMPIPRLFLVSCGQLM